MLVSIFPWVRGEYREIQADVDMKASGPFDSPDTIAGRLTIPPPPGNMREMQANEVLYEGEVYRFKTLRPDGLFELNKAW